MEPTDRDSSDNALFISRAGADADFAAQVASILESAGYAVTLSQWDFPNRNFLERMHAALVAGARVVALLSPEYLRSDYCQAEWQNAIADDPLNTKSRLILLRIAECEPVGLLRGLAYCDLVAIHDNRALLREAVLEAVRRDRDREAATGAYWRAPRTILDTEAVRSVPSFTGRQDELAAVAAALANDGARVAVYGLGGVGKSSLAREYAWRSRDQFAVVWWLNAQTEDGIIDGLLRLGAIFARGLDQLKDRRAAAQQVVGSILTAFVKPVLLVFDNLDDERLLRAWQPRTGTRALLTSRHAAWDADIIRIPLHTWGQTAAADYLRGQSARDDLSEGDARAIVEALGELPLAVAHAAAYLRGVRMVTPQRYLERISEHLRSAPRNADYPTSVFATLGTAVAHAEREAQGAAAILCFAASFAPDAIADELFQQPVENYSLGLVPAVADEMALDLRSILAEEERLDEALGVLDQLSLLTFSQVSRTYGMHRLVQLVTRRELVARDALPAWSECAIRVADAAFPDPQLSTLQRCSRLLPHARAALQSLPPESAFDVAAKLAHRCAVYLWMRGEYPAAEELNERALAIRERALGPEHPDVARSLNNLASVHRDQGRYERAEALYTRALAVLEKSLGPEHPDVARSLNNIASLYQAQGRYQEMQALHERALAIVEHALGPEHPDVAISLDNLAVAYDEQEQYELAEPLHERALAIAEKSYGPEHPDVAHSLNNLAALYEKRGRYEEAAALDERALVIFERALGPDHPDVARSLNGLANAYRELRRFGEAEPLYRRALAIREKALGADHPDVAALLNDLAQYYEARAQPGEAERLYATAIAIRERVLGADHRQTREIRARLAALSSK